MILFSYRGYDLPGPLKNWLDDPEEGMVFIVDGIVYDDRGYPIAETEKKDTADESFVYTVRNWEPSYVLSTDCYFVYNIHSRRVWHFPDWTIAYSVSFNPLTRKYKKLT